MNSMKLNRILFFAFALFIFTSHANAQSNTVLIEKYLTDITKTEGFRNYKNLEALNKTADYIEFVFRKYADTVYTQNFTVNGVGYKNVICSYGTHNDERIIVGAHYDVCGDQEGADDNASGIVGLLELSRQLKGQTLSKRIDLVAYTLEEPPYFRTEAMGSHVHAKFLSDNNINVYGMVSLEMIGFFNDEKKSQTYPIGILSLFYGNKGNYITLVKKFGAGKFVRKFSKKFKKSDAIRTKKFSAPPSLPGIDYSDHLNYWKFGFSAMMITDTSFYRNANYHEKTDTMSTLDIPRLAKVIDGVLASLIKL